MQSHNFFFFLGGGTNLCQGATKHKVSLFKVSKFRTLVLELHLRQIFCQTHIDRDFLIIIKSCSRHPKMSKMPKTENLKFL